ncbi:MAG: response regulator [Bacteroidales bacterium]|nr:response regulator [Bacteroidales bacterium]
MKAIDTLYVVDDDNTFQFLAGEVIKSTNAVNKIKYFSNGAEAISYLESVIAEPANLPEVIFLDLFMPVMDGWGFLQEYTRLKPSLSKKITIYILSSSIDPNDVERAKSITDVSDYIIKPITKDKFLNALSKYT